MITHDHWSIYLYLNGRARVSFCIFRRCENVRCSKWKRDDYWLIRSELITIFLRLLCHHHHHRRVLLPIGENGKSKRFVFDDMPSVRTSIQYVKINTEVHRIIIGSILDDSWRRDILWISICGNNCRRTHHNRFRSTTESNGDKHIHIQFHSIYDGRVTVTISQ